jgi:soluble lytic murein transglycosylase-like protein
MRRVVLIAATVLALAATRAHADVIEIEQDGTVTILAGHVAAQPGAAVAAGQPGISLDAHLDQTASRTGLPSSLLKAVVWQESRGRADAISPKGAIGLMQLMPGTARMLGVDPHDPIDNVRGGALYLRRQLDRFGSMPLALAAYNAGPGAVERYGGIPPFRETRNYVASIMGRIASQNGAVRSPTTPDPIAQSSNPFVIEVSGL